MVRDLDRRGFVAAAAAVAAQGCASLEHGRLPKIPPGPITPAPVTMGSPAVTPLAATPDVIRSLSQHQLFAMIDERGQMRDSRAMGLILSALDRSATAEYISAFNRMRLYAGDPQLAGELRYAISRWSDAKIAAGLDVATRGNDRNGISLILDSLAPVTPCSSYAFALRHIRNYPHSPELTKMWLDRIGAETTARLGNRAPDLLREYAELRPNDAERLARIIEKTTEDRAIKAISGISIKQEGFPLVAQDMRVRAAQARSRQIR